MTALVLFVCVHNAGRSQMAEAFFNQIARERGLDAVAQSAGTEPGNRVHPEVVAVMREVGLDLSTKQPKLLTNELAQGADRIITLGCAVDEGTCPAVFITGVEDWGLPDPKGQPIETVRAIRDDIRRRVATLVASLETLQSRRA